MQAQLQLKAQTKVQESIIKKVLDKNMPLLNPFNLMVQVPVSKNPFNEATWARDQTFSWFAYSSGKLKARDNSTVMLWGTCCPKDIQNNKKTNVKINKTKNNKNNKNTNDTESLEFKVIGACRYKSNAQILETLRWKRDILGFMNVSAACEDKFTKLIDYHLNRTSQVKPNTCAISSSVLDAEMDRIRDMTKSKPPSARQTHAVYTRLADIADGFMRFISRTPLAVIGHDNGTNGTNRTYRSNKTNIPKDLGIQECQDCKAPLNFGHASAPTYPLTRQAADKLYKNLMDTHHYNMATGALEPKRFGISCPHISWPSVQTDNVKKTKQAFDLYANHVLGYYSDATWKDPKAIEAAANRYHGANIL